MREKLTIYPLQQAMFAFVLVHAALSPPSTVGEKKNIIFLLRVRSLVRKDGDEGRYIQGWQLTRRVWVVSLWSSQQRPISLVFAHNPTGVFGGGIFAGFGSISRTGRWSFGS